jgi:hypothetical protein
MNLETRVQETEQKFNTKQAERDEHLKKAEECLTEMAKLQGEWRLLQELKAEEEPKKSDKKATTIEAVPAEAEGK